MTSHQLDIFTSSGPEPKAEDAPDIATVDSAKPDPERTVPPTAAGTAESASRPEQPRRTQMRGPLPGTTFEDAFGGDDA